MYANVHILNENIESDSDPDYIDFSKKDSLQVNKTIISNIYNPKFGDLVEDYFESGYRTNGLYIIDKNASEDLIISDIAHDFDLYGNIGNNFTLCETFPPGYWTFALEHNYNGKVYWHGETHEEPVSKNIWSLITETDLIQQTRKIPKWINNYKEQILINEDICDVKYSWGTLRFNGNKSIVLQKLNILKNDTNYTNLYFTPSRDINKLSIISEDLWINTDYFKNIENIDDIYNQPAHINLYINNLSTKITNGYKCNKCNKIYKNMGKCLKKHIIGHYPKLIM